MYEVDLKKEKLKAKNQKPIMSLYIHVHILDVIL